MDNELVTPYFHNSTVLKNSTRAKTLRTYECWAAWGGGKPGIGGGFDVTSLPLGGTFDHYLTSFEQQ